MLPRMILAAIATGLSAVWLWMLLRVQKIDWRMAAYCRVLQNQQKIDELRKKEDENCRKVEESYGGMKVLMRLLLTTDYAKAIAKLEKENNDLSHGRLKSVNILKLPGFAAVRMFQQLTQNNIYKKILMNCFELYGKKYAPYKAKEAVAEMCSYALFGLAVVFAVGALALSSGNKNGVMAVMLVGPMILLVLVYAIFDTTKDLAEKRRSAIERQLPNVVSKLALLVSSGMIMDKAWRQTAQSSNAELYLEMQKVSEEMDNAVAPEVAYSTFIDTFEITDKDGQKYTIQVIITDTERKEYYDGDPYFQAKSTAVESGYVSNYVMTPTSDSLYSSSENCYQTILLLPGGDAVLDMSQLKPTFYTGSGVQAYAKSVGEAGAVKQTSGQSVVDFTTSPVQYTAKDGADKSIKNYWVTYQAQQEAATLFVNGPSFDELQTEEVADKDKREVYLNTADDYHDIFFANLGKEELTGLSVSLDEEAQKTLKLDDFWTIEDGDALNDFDTCDSDIKSAAKIRLRLKDAPENLKTTEISGVLTVVSNAGTKYIYLTGSILPEIVTESVPNGVKYVPYSVMVQTNNHDDASKVTFSVDAGSLPKGVSLNENTGEIYGVPTKTGTYKFSIKASFSAEGASDSVKEYTIEVAENTDQNVKQENEHPILNYVYDMGENGDIDDWKGKFHEQDFRVDHTYAEFVKFFIDGDLLKEGKDYESSEGSTKITIYRKTFERYGNGKHTIAAEFRNSDNTMTKSTQNYEANVKIKVNPGSSSAPIVSPNKPTTPATPSQSTGRFVDVNKPDWFYDNVMWAAEQGYMVGVSANRFAPKQNTTQAMVVTVLARIAKVDLTAYAGGAQANWYTSAANWAQSLGMIDLDTFEPNAPIRRGDLAVMLLKYFDGIKVSYGVPKQQERVNFFDAAEMTAEEELAFQCCYKEKIFLGNGKNDMQPNGFTTRAQLAALIERIAGHVEANGK